MKDTVREAMLAPGPARTLALLAVTTLLMVMMAIFAVTTQRAAFTSDFEPQPMFPGLADRVNEAAKIVIESRQRTVTVVRDDPSGAGGESEALWRVVEKAGHPARPEMVKRTVVGLADLQLAERRTAQADWHRHIGLRAPDDKGAGVRVAIFDAGGAVMAALIAGKLEGSADIDGRGTIYVRRDGEDQSYVARGSFNLEQQAANWLTTEVLDLAPGRIVQVDVMPAGGPAYTVALADPAGEGQTGDLTGQLGPAYVLRGLDPALQPKTDYAITGIGNALVALTFTDVLAAGDIAFEAPVVSRYMTRDGLAVIVTAEKLGDRYYAALAAEADADAPQAVREEAGRIAALVEPFVYQLTTFDGADLTRTLAALTEPAGPGAGEAGAGEAGTAE